MKKYEGNGYLELCLLQRWNAHKYTGMILISSTNLGILGTDPALQAANDTLRDDVLKARLVRAAKYIVVQPFPKLD